MEKIPLPSKFDLKQIDAFRSELVIEPLFSGYGTTIGNALRRVLLSSIPGAAITAVKIKGVDHEFSTLEGVKEDVVDIILNLKKVRLKVHNNEDVRLTLKVSGKKVVTAGDIQSSSDVEVINKDLQIATITSDNVEFEMELIVNRGRGYVQTEARQDETREIGMIAIDSIYTPVRNVGMKVENVRVGQLTTFEQVTLDIETDGTVEVKDVVALAAQILIDHFTLITEKDLEPQTVRAQEPVVEQNLEENEEFTGSSEVEAPAPKKRGRPKKQELEEVAE